MREILFRGKRIDNEQWVHGSFCTDAIEQFRGLCGVDGFIRLYDKANGKMQMHEVDRETVGQFTGLTDKNGTKVFEGDIVKNGDYLMLVVWYDFHASFMLAFSADGNYYEAISNSHIYLEVVGNIHDNPELLEAE